jgi:hypothetical protein
MPEVHPYWRARRMNPDYTVQADLTISVVETRPDGAVQFAVTASDKVTGKHVLSLMMDAHPGQGMNIEGVLLPINVYLGGMDK